eukprot:GFKZ01000285.1.p1 GENE.GFKZ01000285.1~~GFKZ01000285.1.p1  ORF type:complete len:114 (-),score=3.17 GFKZ01000285.1:210-551(-)
MTTKSSVSIRAVRSGLHQHFCDVAAPNNMQVLVFRWKFKFFTMLYVASNYIVRQVDQKNTSSKTWLTAVLQKALSRPSPLGWQLMPLSFYFLGSPSVATSSLSMNVPPSLRRA